MRIKLFEDFNRGILSTVLDELDQCLVDLRDKGFVWIIDRADIWSSSIGNLVIPFSLHKSDKSGFTPDEIRDSIETMIEYFDEKYGVKSYSITKPDSPGPGIAVKLNNRWDNRTIFWLNIKINLGREN